ncbi:MAG: amidohydrolase family protein [Rhodothermales bacterium]
MKSRLLLSVAATSVCLLMFLTAFSRTDPDQGAEPIPHERNVLSEQQPTDLLYIDTHNHIVGRRDRRSGRLDVEGPARSALESMNASGVQRTLIMPMPQVEDQQHKLYLDDLLPLVEQYPDRFAVLGGGGSLNVLIQRAISAGQVTDDIMEEFEATAAELIKKGAVGFGEMTAEHLSMRPDHPYIAAPPDHPLFLRLADLAATYGVPIDLHMEAIPEDMPRPSRLRSPNPSVLKANIPGLERLLAHNREANIVWVHLGWDNTGLRTVDLTRRLLEKHPNLYLSLRVASGMQARNVVQSTFPVDSQGHLKPEWLELLTAFPDRFVIGSDEIIQQGNRHPSAGSIQATVGILPQLPEALQRKMGYENAYRLYNLTP